MICPACGNELFSSDKELCPHHLSADEGACATNRVMCDFLHRGKAPARVKEDWDPSWAASE